MAASAWQLYYHVPYLAGAGTINLSSTGPYRVVLMTSSYSPSAASTAWSALSATEISSGSGYTKGGDQVANTYTRSSGVTTFDSDDPTWSVSTGTTTSISAYWAVLVHNGAANGTMASSDVPLAWCQLDTSNVSYSVSPGNNFVIQINSAGYFTQTVSTS